MTGPPDSPSRRRWPWVLSGLFVLLLLLVFAFFKDDPLDDFSDLAIIDPPPSSSGQVASEAWLEAARLIDRASITAARAADPTLDLRFDGYVAWDAERIKPVLDANRDAFDAALRADALGRISAPLSGHMDDHSGHLVNASYQIDDLLRIFTAAAFAENDLDTASQIALVRFRFCEELVEQNTSLVSLTVAQGLHALALKPLERITDEDPSAPILERIAKVLAHPLETTTALKRQILFDFAHMSGLLDEVAFGDAPPPILKGRGTPPHFLFKRNRTQNKLAAITRAQLEAIAQPRASRSTFPSPTQPTGLALLSSNAFGDHLIALGFTNSVDSMNRPAAHRALLRVKIALLRYHLDHRTLPETLAELVPTYLDTVPSDPCDGKPIRYDPARGAVWVVGRDLQDNGGSTKSGKRGYRSNDPDPTLFVFPHQTATAP